jgi:hypothetical protein
MPSQNTVPTAETTALKALAYLGESEDPFGRFIDQTGLSPDSLRERIAEPEFLTAVLDFLLTDDSLLMGFCEQEGLQPKDVYAAKRALGGHD